jgi:hypothetical protein
MDVLANVLWLLACNSCGEQHIYITEDFSKRKGCSSLLHVCYASCGWQHSFYTSLKIRDGDSKAFCEVENWVEKGS